MASSESPLPTWPSAMSFSVSAARCIRSPRLSIAEPRATIAPPSPSRRSISRPLGDSGMKRW